MSEKNLQVTDFKGTVLLKAHQIFPDGNHYIGITGNVSVLDGKAATGFEIKDESSWFARVESEDGERSVNILGCQVKGILQGDFSSEPPNFNFLQMG